MVSSGPLLLNKLPFVERHLERQILSFAPALNKYAHQSSQSTNPFVVGAGQLHVALRNLVIGMLRLCRVKNIAAALRHYSWKLWETLALISLPCNN